MAETVLSREIVELATRGVVEAEAAIDRTKKATDRLGGSVAAARQFVDRMAQSLITVSRFGVGAFTGLIFGAARGTVEGDQFSRALTRLTRVLGDEFAPLVRGVAQGMTELATAYRGLDSETRKSIATGVGVAAAFAGILVVTRNLTAAVVGGASAWLLFSETGNKILDALADKVTFLHDMFVVLWSDLTGRQFVAPALPKKGAAGAGPLGEWEAAIGRIQNAMKGGGFHVKFDVQFESLTATFERLQKAFAGQEGVNLQQAQLDELKGINDGVQKAAAGIGRIGDLVPGVR